MVTVSQWQLHKQQKHKSAALSLRVRGGGFGMDVQGEVLVLVPVFFNISWSD